MPQLDLAGGLGIDIRNDRINVRVSAVKMVSRTHEGLVRINNEDCVHIDADVGFAVLADGMGGLLAGEEASSIAVETVCRALIDESQACNTLDAAGQLMLRAHEAVLEHARELHYEGKMGTTLVICVQGGGELLYSHVGDSRLYSWNGVELTQQTSDHTVAQRMIDMGKFPADQAYRAPNRHVLTQAVGLPGLITPEVGKLPTARRLLLCSDGLSDMVRDRRIAELLQVSDLDECADMLLSEALAEGGRDNVSMALIDLDQVDLDQSA
jgi:protein phosphatase